MTGHARHDRTSQTCIGHLKDGEELTIIFNKTKSNIQNERETYAAPWLRDLESYNRNNVEIINIRQQSSSENP